MHNLWMDSLFTVTVLPCCVLIMRQLSDNGHWERATRKWKRKLVWDAKFVHFLLSVPIRIGPLGAVNHCRWGRSLCLAVMCLFPLTGVTHVKVLVSGASLCLLLFGLAFNIVSTLRVILLAACGQTPAVSVRWHGWNCVQLTLTCTLVNFQKGNLSEIQLYAVPAWWHSVYCCNEV